MPSWIIKGSAVVLIGDGRHGDGRDNIARLCLLASVRGNGEFSEKVAVRGFLVGRARVCLAGSSGYRVSGPDPTTMRRRFALSEQHTEQSIKVRQITDVHANWSYQGPLQNGKFSYQLILDNGAEEALIMPTADDAKVLRDLIHDADTLYWDTEKEVIIFGKVD
jgi:hypothetical protein